MKLRSDNYSAEEFSEWWSPVQFSSSQYCDFLRSSNQKKVAGHWLANLVKSTCKSQTDLNILDLGAGDGRLISAFIDELELLEKNKVSSTTLATLVEPEGELKFFLISLRDRFQSCVHTNLSVYISTAESWLDKHHDEQFDLILLMHVIYYLDPATAERIILNCLKILKPNGIICLSVCHSESWLADFRTYFIKQDPNSAYSNFLTHRPVLNFLTARGISWQCHEVKSNLCLKVRSQKKSNTSQHINITRAEILSFLTKIRADFLHQTSVLKQIDEKIESTKPHSEIVLTDAFICITKAQTV